MQAVGMVNDHLVTCHRHEACAKLGRTRRSEHDDAKAVATQPQARAWQRMLSGRRLDLLDPSPLDIEIEDIAHGIARVPRWNGQTIGAHIFSVAQHTLLVDTMRAPAGTGLDRPPAARDPAARRARICGGRHDHAVQGGDRRFLQGGGTAPACPPSTSASACRRSCRAAQEKVPSSAPTAPRPISRRRALAGFDEAEARRFFGVPPKLSPALERDYLTPWPAETAEARYLERFAKLAG